MSNVRFSSGLLNKLFMIAYILLESKWAVSGLARCIMNQDWARPGLLEVSLFIDSPVKQVSYFTDANSIFFQGFHLNMVAFTSGFFCGYATKKKLPFLSLLANNIFVFRALHLNMVAFTDGYLVVMPHKRKKTFIFIFTSCITTFFFICNFFLLFH